MTGMLKPICLSVSFMLIQSVIAWNDQPNNLMGDEIRKPGENIEMKCFIDEFDRQFPIFWIKTRASTPVIISNGSSLAIKSDKFEVAYDNVSLLYSLEIKNIGVSDEGLYRCTLMKNSSYSITLSQMKLFVRELPFIFNNSTKLITGKPGETIELECYAGGVPKPRISWRRHGYVALPDGRFIYKGNVLTIPKLHKNDRGVYVCEVINNMERPVYQVVRVFVESSPEVQIERSVKIAGSNTTTDVVCKVIAYPRPTITWQKDGLEVRANVQRREAFGDHDEYEIVLYTDFTHNSDFGTYTCKAENQLGVTVKAIILEKKDLK